MLISEAIAQLEELKKEHGDCDVYFEDRAKVPRLGFNISVLPVKYIYHTAEMHNDKEKRVIGIVIE